MILNALSVKLKCYDMIQDESSCRYNTSKSGATIRNYVDIKSGSESQLKKAVAAVGPISVAIDASKDSFHFYHGGES